jgi:hypothetical protein
LTHFISAGINFSQKPHWKTEFIHEARTNNKSPCRLHSPDNYHIFCLQQKKIDYIKKTQGIEKKACTCTDNACAKLALKDYQSLFEELKQNRATGTVEELRQINASTKKIHECLKKNRITEKEINDIIKSN